MSTNYLASYRPLCSTAQGRRACVDHDLAPFLDGSCRREPDLAHERPAITALCRAGRFAPRLGVGDGVAFVTVRGRYQGDLESGWRLTALLRVVERFESHEDAAAWYRGRGSSLPSNCMVRGNPPEPLERTSGTKSCRDCGDRAALARWDAFYLRRARAHPVVLACEKLSVELTDPPRIRATDWVRWYGSIPGTQTPPSIGAVVWRRLEERARRKAA